jgi:CubicO group peptidase (beta-lactamase class C family)
MTQSTHITQEQAAALGVSTERLEWLDAYLQRMIDEEKHPFEALRVWRRGTLVFSGDYGPQAPGGGPLRSDAIFAMASVTKSVTATCAAILQEQGRINFYERVQDRFPEFVGENKERVLLWHLLSHTSGMDGDEIDKRLEEQAALIRENAAKAGFDETAVVKLADAFWSGNDNVWKAPLTTIPGTKFSYWGFGYHIFKLLIERVTGDSLEAFARKHIFEPLGMKDTCWYLPEEKRGRYALRPDGVKGMPWMNGTGTMEDDGAGGGLKSTMDDMARFGRMYLGGGSLDGRRILSPASVKLLTKNHNVGVPDSFWFGRWLSSSWGLGWDVKGDKIDDLGMLHSAKSYNHGGYGGARLLIDPEYDLVVSIYMCEKAESSVYDDMNCAVDILYGALD